MKNPWVIIGIIAVVLFGGSFWYASVSAERNNEGVEVMTHVKGNPEASVTLVEYSDLQCPACASFQPAINTVMEQYGDNLRFEYKHFPLPIHRLALPAAVAAEAAGQQGKFFEYHDLLFANQTAWSQSANPQIQFIQYAEELDLDIETFRRHSNATLLRDHVQQQFAEGRELGVTGTPTFFLNGERMAIETFEDFVTQVGVAVTGSSTAPEAVEATSSEPAVQFGI